MSGDLIQAVGNQGGGFLAAALIATFAGVFIRMLREMLKEKAAENARLLSSLDEVVGRLGKVVEGVERVHQALREQAMIGATRGEQYKSLANTLSRDMKGLQDDMRDLQIVLQSRRRAQ